VQNLANLYMALGRDEEAEALLKRAESIILTAKRGSDERPSYRPQALGGNLEYLAIIRTRQGRHAEAESLLKQAIALNESTGFFPEPGQSQLLAPLARTYVAQGRYAESRRNEKLARREICDCNRRARPCCHIGDGVQRLFAFCGCGVHPSYACIVRPDHINAGTPANNDANQLFEGQHCGGCMQGNGTARGPAEPYPAAF
jgi:tetratricopeptide (TPR) repeat protein